MLQRLVYVSAAVHHFEPEELAQLLAVSRRNNERDDVTGLLLHVGGNFMQCLEGPAEAVSATLERIRSDPRHTSLRVMLDMSEVERLFADWSMAFREVGNLPSEIRERISSFLDDLQLPEDALLSGRGTQAVAVLLEGFARSMR